MAHSDFEGEARNFAERADNPALAPIAKGVAELMVEVARLSDRNRQLEAMLLRSMEMTTELLAMARTTTFLMVPK